MGQLYKQVLSYSKTFQSTFIMFLLMYVIVVNVFAFGQVELISIHSEACPKTLSIQIYVKLSKL